MPKSKGRKAGGTVADLPKDVKARVTIAVRGKDGRTEERRCSVLSAIEGSENLNVPSFMRALNDVIGALVRGVPAEAICALEARNELEEGVNMRIVVTVRNPDDPSQIRTAVAKSQTRGIPTDAQVCQTVTDVIQTLRSPIEPLQQPE